MDRHANRRDRKGVKRLSARYTEEWLANYNAKRAQPNGASLAQNAPPALQVGKSYRFTVFGVARPAGSKQAFVPLHPKTKEPYRNKNGGIVVSVVDDNPRTKKWRNHVSQTAREEYSGPLLTGFVSLECVFYLPRPKGHFGTGANEHRIKPSAPAMPGVKPDVDKLLRAVSDGLTQSRNVYVDDALIVDSIGRKRYGNPRVEITVKEIVCGPSENQPELFSDNEVAPWDAKENQ